MDAEHRHELRDNDLVKWIMSTPKYVSDNYMQIIGVCCIIMAILLYRPIRNIGKKGLLEDQTAVTANINSLEVAKLKALSESATGGDMVTTFAQTSKDLALNGADSKSELAGALAMIKAGEAMRIDLHYTKGEVARETIEANIDQAKVLYAKALGMAKGNATLTAMAKYGLGLCEEELGNYGEAETIYTEISSDEGLGGTVYSAAAAKRLEVIGEFQQKVVFVDRPAEIVMPEVPNVLDTIGDVVDKAVGGSGDVLTDVVDGAAEKVQE
ncbi:MAG: hypothetical protein KAS23_03965 [Anaerohalosphaera sp.]|nr:hypothetical protein [Anaerohalosphaera sp.]